MHGNNPWEAESQKRTPHFFPFPDICEYLLQDLHRKAAKSPFPLLPFLYKPHNFHPEVHQCSGNLSHRSKIPAAAPEVPFHEVPPEACPSPPSPEAFPGKPLRDLAGFRTLYTPFPEFEAVCSLFPVLAPDLCCNPRPVSSPPVHPLYPHEHCTFPFPCPPDCELHRSEKCILRKYPPRKIFSDKHWDQIHNYNHRLQRPPRLPDPGTFQRDTPAISSHIPAEYPCHSCPAWSTVQKQHHSLCPDVLSPTDSSQDCILFYRRSTAFPSR